MKCSEMASAKKKRPSCKYASGPLGSLSFILIELTKTSSGSIATSIHYSTQNHKFEHGRRYHAYQDGKYALLNDIEETARLGMYMYSSNIAIMHG